MSDSAYPMPLWKVSPAMPVMAPREKEGAGLDVQHRSACAAADSLIVSKVYPKPAGKVREKSIFAFSTPSEVGTEEGSAGRISSFPDVEFSGTLGDHFIQFSHFKS